ncbi:MAG: SagB/ThcOx family dehydrogenase [Actinobacteria bacterium]|nr:SagB/ThcOx family dehydrogenase [Actinomycetota bacterium]
MKPLVRAVLYGDDEPGLDDPAELYHEASKLHPALAFRQASGLARLGVSEELQAAALHAQRRNSQLPFSPLGEPDHPACSLWTALDRRRSSRTFGDGVIEVAALATILDAAYGLRDGTRRTVPSGGALYPLELYVAARRVERIEAATYRYDPQRHGLELYTRGDPWPALTGACPLDGLVDGGAAAILVRAVFGRTRFKYGQRGYRFALLEAGHAMQNAVLAAAALQVPALPLGGYYDARVDELVGADGVEESVVYALVLGGR